MSSKPTWAVDVRNFAFAIAAFGLATLVLGRWLHVTNPTIVALTYLLVVLMAAALSALWVPIASSALAVLLLNYFFLPPVGGLTIADPQNWVALLVLLAVSVIASNLSSSVRARAQEALERRDEMSRLFDLSRDILLTTQSEDAYLGLARSVVLRFNLEYVAICLPGPEGLRVHDAGSRALALPRGDLEAALEAAQGAIEFDARDRTYGGHRVISGADGVVVGLTPLRLGGRAIGLMASAGRAVEAGTLDALAGVVAIAVERVQFLEERKAAELVRQGNELKSALLASLAHDLRTPLTAIRVAASNLQADWPNAEERRTQSDIVLTEVERLGILFQNILDMARIETNAVTAVREWVTPEDIAEAATAQIQHALRKHRPTVTAASDRFVEVDPRVTSAAIAHLLENAAQYSPEDTTVSIEATATADGLSVVVRDEGPGIAAADLPHLFERFYRGGQAGRHSVGAGMGLAITRGLLAAEGGRVWAENRPGGGAQFSIAVPASVRPAPQDLEDSR
jgi:two-component system, OmpR family, sensor histidine kinase KdpD